jgi:hypothetical protein
VRSHFTPSPPSAALKACFPGKRVIDGSVTFDRDDDTITFTLSRLSRTDARTLQDVGLPQLPTVPVTARLTSVNGITAEDAQAFEDALMVIDSDEE